MNEGLDAVEPGTARFSTDPSGLPECRPAEVVELGDGEAFDLRVGAVATYWAT